MTSAVTNNLRNLLLDQFKGDIESSSRYYVGLARSEDFTASTDISSRAEQFKLRNTLQSVKVVSNVSFVVPTINWNSGTVYEAYNDNDPAQTNFYVLNSNNEVFICIEQGMDDTYAAVASIVEPTNNTNGKTFRTSDGYKWRFMYKLSNLAISNFKTSSYIPVETMVDSASQLSIPEEVAQRLLQDAAVDGEILSIAIDGAGSGYLSSSTINITGDGNSASFSLTSDGDQIKRVQVDSDGNGEFSHGSSYSYAATIPTDGTGATLRPIIAPAGGLAADPVVSLKSSALMIQLEFQGDETNTILSENDFGQVALIRSPKKYNSDSDFTSNTGNCLKYFETAPTSDEFVENELIQKQGGGAIAKVFYHDTINNKLYYFQDQSTGFDLFEGGDTITNIEGSARSFQIVSVVNPDVDIYSGEIFYLNNISSAIPREETQTEDIRIVIELG